MKEASGELNLTVIVVVIVALLAFFFFSIIWPRIDGNFKQYVYVRVKIVMEDVLFQLVKLWNVILKGLIKRLCVLGKVN